MVDELEIATTIHAPRTDVYGLLRDVEGYGEYSEFVEEVTRHSDDAGVATYDVILAWWRLSASVRVVLTDVDPPGRIDWRLEDVDARGVWHLEPAVLDDMAAGTATDVTVRVRYDPDSGGEAVSLPPLVPMSTVVERARPIVEREARRILKRVVTDLEGEPRPATLEIHVRHDVG